MALENFRKMGWSGKKTLTDIKATSKDVVTGTMIVSNRLGLAIA